MDDRFILSVKEERLLLDFFSTVVKKALNRKQKIILLSLTTHGNGFTVTGFVRTLSRELQCSRSALWNNIDELKEMNLIECGNGDPVRLTPLGAIVKYFTLKEDVLYGREGYE